MHSESITKRFWSKVDTSGGPDACWLWVGGLNGKAKANHYGMLRLYGRKGIKKYAHRLSWEIHYGPIPEGAEVCHNCPGGDNPACVNPSHLFIGSHADNMRDMARKGRAGGPGTPGTRHPMARLNESQVRSIRAAVTSGETCPSVAVRYGLSRSTVQKIANRKLWKHLP